MHIGFEACMQQPKPGDGLPTPTPCPVLYLPWSCPALPCSAMSFPVLLALLCSPVYSPVLCFSSVTRNGGGRVELGSWTWEKSEAVVAKAPTGPPLIRLDKALIKSTRCGTTSSRVTRYAIIRLTVRVVTCEWDGCLLSRRKNY